MANMTKFFNLYMISFGFILYATTGLYAAIKRNKTEGEILSGFEHGKTSFKYTIYET